MNNFSLAFTGIASLGMFGGFGLEFWRFRKYRNWQYLNTDLVLLFFLAGLCLTVSGIASMWDTASEVQQYGRKAIWISFSVFMCSVCSWLLRGWFKNRKKRGVNNEIDTSIVDDQTSPLSDDEEVDDSLKSNDDESKEFEIISGELTGDSGNSKVEGSDEDTSKEVFIDIPEQSKSDDDFSEEEVTPDVQVNA